MPRDSEFFITVRPARFAAYACGEAHTHLHLAPQARTFLEAALEFSETWHGADPQLKVIVIDRQTGREECFMVDLGAEAAQACG